MKGLTFRLATYDINRLRKNHDILNLVYIQKGFNHDYAVHARLRITAHHAGDVPIGPWAQQQPTGKAALVVSLSPG